MQERIRNYFQKYEPLAREVIAAGLTGIEGDPGTPRHEKARRALISVRLDARAPRRTPTPELPAPTVEVAIQARAR